MADVIMTVYDLTRAVSTAPNYTDNKTAATSANTYYIPNNGKVGLLAAAATTANLTIETTKTIDGLAVTDLVLALADTDIRVFGTFPPEWYNNSSEQLKLTTSANADLFAVRFGS